MKVLKYETLFYEKFMKDLKWLWNFFSYEIYEDGDKGNSH